MDINLQKKLKTVGNYVHDDVPISDNEVPDVSVDSRAIGADVCPM